MKRELKRRQKERETKQFKRWKLKIQNDLNNYNVLQKEIEEIEENTLGICAQNTQCFDMPTGGRDDHTSKTEQQAFDLIRLKEELEKTKKVIDKVVNNLDEPLRTYFEMRYIKEFTLIKICRELYFERDTYFKMNNNLIKIVGKEMGLID